MMASDTEVLANPEQSQTVIPETMRAAVLFGQRFAVERTGYHGAAG